MLKERVRDREYTQYLKEDLAFLKAELIQKNEFISILLLNCLVKSVETRPSTMQNITENVVNKTPIDNIVNDMGVNNNVESLTENTKVILPLLYPREYQIKRTSLYIAIRVAHQRI